MSLPVVILAGGLATRLGTLTKKIPKSLVEVAGVPFIFHQLELLQQYKISKVVLCVGHMGEQIQAVLGDNRQWGIPLEYSFDYPTLLGTGGAIRHALPLLNGPFFVLHGDSYLECDYVAIEQTFYKSGKLGLMTVLCNMDRWDRSNILFECGKIRHYDKHYPTPSMRHIDYGLGILQSEIFKSYPENKSLDLAVVYQDLLRHDQLVGFEIENRFYEIGSFSGLEETQRYLAEKKRK